MGTIEVDCFGLIDADTNTFTVVCIFALHLVTINGVSAFSITYNKKCQYYGHEQITLHNNDDKIYYMNKLKFIP